MTDKIALFGCNKPCGNCPYRTDAPKKLWHKEEFEKLLNTQGDTIGRVYKCHKNNGSVCVGWLIKQDDDNFPSIALRMELSRNNITREYLDNLSSPAPLFGSIEEMIEANYPELIKTLT